MFADDGRLVKGALHTNNGSPEFINIEEVNLTSNNTKSLPVRTLNIIKSVDGKPGRIVVTFDQHIISVPLDRCYLKTTCQWACDNNYYFTTLINIEAIEILTTWLSTEHVLIYKIHTARGMGRIVLTIWRSRVCPNSILFSPSDRHRTMFALKVCSKLLQYHNV